MRLFTRRSSGRSNPSRQQMLFKPWYVGSPMRLTSGMSASFEENCNELSRAMTRHAPLPVMYIAEYMLRWLLKG